MSKKNEAGTDDGGMISSGAPATDMVGDLAENLGKYLGQTEASLRGWFGQRDAFIKNLVEIRDRANKLLSEAGYQTQETVRAAVGRRRGRPPGSGKKAAQTAKRGPGRPKGPGKKQRKGGGMSAEGRARVSAAQKARWAAKKAGSEVGNG